MDNISIRPFNTHNVFMWRKFLTFYVFFQIAVYSNIKFQFFTQTPVHILCSESLFLLLLVLRVKNTAQLSTGCALRCTWIKMNTQTNEHLQNSCFRIFLIYNITFAKHLRSIALFVLFQEKTSFFVFLVSYVWYSLHVSFEKSPLHLKFALLNLRIMCIIKKLMIEPGKQLQFLGLSNMHFEYTCFESRNYDIRPDQICSGFKIIRMKMMQLNNLCFRCQDYGQMSLFGYAHFMLWPSQPFSSPTSLCLEWSN